MIDDAMIFPSRLRRSRMPLSLTSLNGSSLLSNSSSLITKASWGRESQKHVALLSSLIIGTNVGRPMLG